MTTDYRSLWEVYRFEAFPFDHRFFQLDMTLWSETTGPLVKDSKHVEILPVVLNL